MPTLPKDLLVRIKGSSAELEKAAERSQSVLRRIGGAAKLTAGTVLGIGAAAAGVAFAIKRGLLDPFAEQQAAVASLGAALSATGKVGVDSLKAVADEASRLQRVTTFGDEALIKASGTLATLAPALNTDELVKAQTAIAGIATTFTGGDVNAAAQLLGKTLGGTTNALGRYGIQVDTSASASEKLAQVLGSETLGASFDVAQAQANTLQGRFTQLANVAGDMRELFGEIIAKALGLGEGTGGLVNRIADVNDAINRNMDRWVAWARVAITNLKAIFVYLVELVRIIWNAAQVGYRAFSALAFSVGAAFEAALDGVARTANALIEGINKLPGVEIDFRFAESGNRFLELAKDRFAEIGRDVDTIVGSTNRLADSWVDVGEAIAAAVGTGAGNSNPLGAGAGAGAGGGGGGGGGGDGAGGRADPTAGYVLDPVAPGLLVGFRTEIDLTIGKVRELSMAVQDATEAVVRELDHWERQAVSLTENFATALGDAVFEGKEAFRKFVDYAIRELVRLAAKLVVFNLIKTLFPGSNLLGPIGQALGIGGVSAAAVSVEGGGPSLAATRGAAATPQASAGFTVGLDLSGMPPAADPRQAARDVTWLRFLYDSQRALAVRGG